VGGSKGVSKGSPPKQPEMNTGNVNNINMMSFFIVHPRLLLQESYLEFAILSRTEVTIISHGSW